MTLGAPSKSSLSGFTRGAGCLALLMSVAWSLVMMMATAIGTKAPTAAEMFAFLWPALGAIVLAFVAFALRSKGQAGLGAATSVAAIVFLVAGVRYIMP